MNSSGLNATVGVMMPDYGKEDCTGCKWLGPRNSVCWCDVSPRYKTDTRPAFNACNHFSPSIECRKVIALEIIADRLDPVRAGPVNGCEDKMRTLDPEDCACGFRIDPRCRRYASDFCEADCEYHPERQK
jgi:hypothetical protein